MTARIEPIVGRYIRTELGGRPHRIYFEQAGEGIPLLCLHTAGADGRQYRAILNDLDITRHFQVTVFDMPWHGKSSPPEGWQDEEYRLTAIGYIELIQMVMGALRLDRPVVMGCSIGGRVVLHLARECPEAFRALIGLQSSAHVGAYYDLDWLHRPDVHGGEVCAGVVSGLIAPQSPSVHRWETLWHYMQGGPGVFKGDLHFYRVDGDIREQLGAINTARCPLYLLTGEYDYSCSPDDSRFVAAQVPGATLRIMASMGHFPMSENPQAFRSYLLPVLEEIRTAPRSPASA